MVACGVEPKGGEPVSCQSLFQVCPKPVSAPSGVWRHGCGSDHRRPRRFPSVTQSETYTTANPDNPNEILVAYNDSSGAGGSPATISGASYSTDGGLTFIRLTPNPFAAAGSNFGDPIALYNKSTGSWHTIWIDTACGGFGLGGYKTTDPLNGSLDALLRSQWR